MGCVWVYMQKVELRHWWEYGDEKTGIKSERTFTIKCNQCLGETGKANTMRSKPL